MRVDGGARQSWQPECHAVVKRWAHCCVSMLSGASSLLTLACLCLCRVCLNRSIATFSNMSAVLKVVEITNNPVPYRVPIYNRVARDSGLQMTHIFSIIQEPGRYTDLPPFEFQHVLLKPNYRSRDDHNVHNNRDVWAVLRRLEPDVVITDGFNPTSLYGFLYARVFGKKHIPMTDGTYHSEQALSWKHRWVRRLVYSGSQAFVGASNGSRDLYASYGIDVQRHFFQSHLCVDNARFDLGNVDRRYDVVFCSRLVEGKRPLFALDVCARAAVRLGRRVKVLFVGAGPLEAALREQVAQVDGVEATVHGFGMQADLPALYNQGRVFLFPTAGDVWGVVINEACASGLAVISTPFAGVVGELVRDGENGHVLDFDAERWAAALADLLTDDARLRQFGWRSRQLVQSYSYDAAAAGLIDAARHAAARAKPML